MIHGFYFHGDEAVASGLSRRQIASALADPGGVLWVDLEAPDRAEAHDLLADVFGFHPLAVEDCLDDEQRPKVEDYGDYVFVVMRIPSVRSQPDEATVADEVDLFLGPNFVVSFHAAGSAALSALRSDAARDARVLSAGADRFAARLLDALSVQVVEGLDRLDDELDAFEGAVFARTDRGDMSRLFQLRHELAAMRRVLGPQRDALHRLSWDPMAPIRPESRLYFREAYDQLVQVLELVDARRDVAAAVLEMHLSAASNRLNETMRLIAAIQMVFLPLTLIASVYGMNFANLPPLRSPDGWRVVLLAMAVVGVLQIVALRRLRWI